VATAKTLLKTKTENRKQDNVKQQKTAFLNVLSQF